MNIRGRAHGPWGAALLAAVLIASAPMAEGADADARPVLTVADASQGCPPISGSFVVLLDPERGMLLLSGAPFPGGRRVGEADGRALRVQLGGSPWTVAAVGVDGGTGGVWADIVPFRGRRIPGCVAFDRDRFSSEGDLASYVIWLVEHVYAELPEEVRARYPAFRLSDREVRLEVEPEGFGALQLAGREGSTLAFRMPGDGRTFVLLPFIVGESGSRVVVRAFATDGEYFSSAEKVPLGAVVLADGEPASLGDPPFEIRLLGAG